MGTNRIVEVGLGVETRSMRRKKTLEIESDTSNLPPDIIYTILSKLPAKSLLRFRCVCKSWRQLVSEPHFIKLHLSEAINSDRRRLICPTPVCYEFHSFDRENVSDEFAEKLPLRIWKRYFLEIRSSCHGLVLLGHEYSGNYVVWNPSTRAHIRFLCPPSISRNLCFCGLCCDSPVDVYKVVFVYRNGGTKKSYVVYTLKSDSWSESKDFSSFRLPHGWRTEVSVNGAPHWLLVPSEEEREHRGGNDIIAYFDPVEEKFKEVPPPWWTQESCIFHLQVIKGRLGLYRVTNQGEGEVWVMKEYGVRDSWAKLYNIPSGKGEHRKLTNEGDILMEVGRGEGFRLYDPKENKWCEFKTWAVSWIWMNIHSYLDSLVFPTRDKLRKRKNINV